MTGSVASGVALPVLVYAETGSALLTSAVAGLEAAPYLVFGLVAGALADRLPRRRTMVLADLAGCLALATIVIVWLAGTLTAAHVLIVAALVGTSFVWFDSASWGAMPRLVGRERLPEANGIVWSSAIALGIVVPGLTGLVVSFTSPVVVLGIDAVSYLVSAAVILTIGKPLGPDRGRTDTDETPARTMRADIGEGLRFVWRHAVLRTLTFAGFGLSLSGGAVVSLLVVHASEELAIAPDDRAVGLLFTASAIGAMAASRLLGPLSRRLGAGRLSMFSYLAYLPLLALLAYATDVWTAMLAWAAWDAAYTIAITNAITIRQQVTPDELQGRVNTTGRMIAWGGFPFGALLGGVLAESVGVQTTYVIACLPVVVGAVAVWRSPVRGLVVPGLEDGVR